MTIGFKTLVRPKRLTQQIFELGYGLTYKEAQNWAARIYGYENWKDLDVVTKEQFVRYSPDDEDVTEEERCGRFLDQLEQLERFAPLSHGLAGQAASYE